MGVWGKGARVNTIAITLTIEKSEKRDSIRESYSIIAWKIPY